MPLKPHRIHTHQPEKAPKKGIAIVEIDGSLVSDYNSASLRLKQAEDDQQKNRAALLTLGLPLLLERCVANPDAAPASIKLQDELGQTVLFTGMNKYGVFDPEKAEPVFAGLGSKIEDHAQFVATAKFDSNIFLAQEGTSAGEAGKFSSKIFKAYQLAIDRVTAQLTRDGLLAPETPSPLHTGQVATVLPTFHTTRWRDFPSVEAQAALFQVVPHTIALKPVLEREVDEETPASKRKR